MFGLFMGIALGIGGIVAGMEHISSNISSENKARKDYSAGINKTGTYYDRFIGSDIDLRTGRRVNIRELDFSGDQYVVDARTGKVLRNITLESTMEKADYERANFGVRAVELYNWHKLASMWDERARKRVPGYRQAFYPDSRETVYMHSKTKRMGFSKYMSNIIKEKTEEYFKELYNYESISLPYYCNCLYDFLNGSLLDFFWPDKPIVIKGIKNGEEINVEEHEIEQVIKLLNEDIEKGELKKELTGWEVLFQ